jgi:hypothetical protein
VLLLQVLRGNIRVMCRVRPPHQQQHSPSRSPAAAAAFGANHGSCISYPLEGLLAVHDASTARQREFEFDAVFAPEASQQQVRSERHALPNDDIHKRVMQSLCLSQ